MDTDTRARLVHEARQHRQQARRLDDAARMATARHDPLAALTYRCAARERRALAKQADAERQDSASAERIARIRARHGLVA